MRKSKRRKLVKNEDDIPIHKDDYRAVAEMLSKTECWGNEIAKRIDRATKTRVTIMEERRVSCLVINIDEQLPEEIGDLLYLEELHVWVPLFFSTIKSIALSSIRRLRDLEYLSIDGSPIDLPDIGDLTRLKTLDLGSVAVLPPSIGRLQNLKVLVLAEATKLKQLPAEIGNLQSLETLDLTGFESRLRSLPPSIGRLRNLKFLRLAEATKLKQLPEEIGDLESLETLDLRNSSIESIPGSIAKLVNLRILNLSGMSNTSFPVSMESLVGGMVCLRELYIYGTNHPEFKSGNDTDMVNFLLTLVQRWKD